MRIIDQVLIIEADTTEEAFNLALTELNWVIEPEATIVVEPHSNLMDKVTYTFIKHRSDYELAQVVHEGFVEVKHNRMFMVYFTIINQHGYLRDI